MNYRWFLGIVRLYFCFAVLLSTKVFKVNSTAIYTNTYAVHVEAGKEAADQVAAMHGFINMGEIIDNHFHFIDQRERTKRLVQPSSHRHLHLQSHPHVKWFEQQTLKTRKKRGHLPGDNLSSSYLPGNTASSSTNFIDPYWKDTWYLNRGKNQDMNVIPAWERGYTGRGVVVSILDDGLEKDHPDLVANYDSDASYDVNDHDNDPQPRYDFTNENRHGTRCAGEVAAQANNSICTIGVAFNANIGGVRMLDGDVTDAVEARSLGHRPQHVDIYSASWGPDDDGKTVDGPGKLARKAFEDGALKGRGGLGSIFVWASGNGGRMMDSCNCDGYTNTIYTLSVSSVSEKGDVPWYSEKCASTLATTYSSGGGGERQVVTVDIRKRCTKLHSGTSASAPLAAAICALALEANPTLTWRDMQHIVVNTAKPDMLKATDWTTNGAGYKVSHSYGFGLMDASAMVDLALRWTTVPPMRTCTQTAVQQRKQIRGKLSVDFISDGCQGTMENVLYLEKVHAVLSITFPRRGDLVIHLTSPMGTKSMLLPKRQHDSASTGFSNWEFMSTHTWGEQPAGVWTLDIQNLGSSSHTGFLTSWTLKLYGTETNPITEIQPTAREPTTERKTTERLATTTKKPLPSTRKRLLTTKQMTSIMQKSTKNPLPNTKQYLPSTKQMTTIMQKTTKNPLPSTKQPLPSTKQTTTIMQKTTKNPLPSTKQYLPSTKQTTTIMQGSTIKHTTPLMDNSTIKINSHTKQYVAKTKLLTTMPTTSKSTLNSLTSKQTPLYVNGPLKTTSYKPIQTTTTKPDCSPGYYREQSLSGEFHCNPCHPSCDRCIASGDTMCIKCLDGSLPFGVDDSNYEQAVGRCIKCNSGCSKCDGPEYRTCTQCKAGWYLNDFGGCDICHRSCKTCVTGEISGCNEKKEIPDCKQITVGEVVTGTYFDENTWECIACAKGCLICDQLGSCSEELPTTQELHSCSVGFYLEVTTSTCKACHADCKTCSGPSELQCLEIKKISSDHCPDGTYLDHGLGICQHCHQRCYTCHGGEDTDCLQERPTTTPCPKGNYKVVVAGHDLTNRVFTESCLPCHKDCETCIGAGINGCTIRRSSVNDCPGGFYLKDTEFEKSCDQCHKSCLTCYGGMATECIDCHADYIKRDTYCVVVYLPLHSRPFVKILTVLSILIVICILLSACIYIKIRKNSSKFSDVKYKKLEESLDQKVLHFEDTNYSI